MITIYPRKKLNSIICYFNSSNNMVEPLDSIEFKKGRINCENFKSCSFQDQNILFFKYFKLRVFKFEKLDLE